MIAPVDGDRAVSPAVGTVLLVVVTVGLVAVGTTVVGSTPLEPSATTGSIAMSVTADDSGTIELTHEGGPPVDVRDVSVHVSVDGQPLDEQPPVPFFSARGFAPGPTGAFNSASDDRFSVGETTTVTVASTNAPTIDAGSRVTVELRQNDRVLASDETSVPGRPGDGDEG